MNKKNILVISFFFQPFNTIGAVRVSSWVKYLQDKGYSVHVVTAKRNRNLNLSIAKDNNIHYINWPNADRFLNLSDKYPNNKLLWLVSRVLNRITIYSTSHLPEGAVAIWRFLAFLKARRIINNNQIDLIYTSSGPASSAIIGSKLAKKYNITWVPEFRDLWSNNAYSSLSKKQKIRNLNTEKRIIGNATHIITVNKALQHDLMLLHKKPVSIAYNGYFYEKYDKQTINDKLTISHLGTIYPNKRDPSVLFQAVNDLATTNQITTNDLLIKFYGLTNKYIEDLVLKYNISNYIELNGLVSSNDAIEIQKNSDVLLLLSWNNIKDQATPGKLFEYIGMRTPILGICYPGEIKSILEETGTGTVINELEEMKSFLLYAISIYKESPRLGFPFKEQCIKSYSRYHQNQKIEDVISVL